MLSSRITRAAIACVAMFMSLSPSVASDELSLDSGTAGLVRTLKQLQSTLSVLHTVAHPDDEDGPMLTYCARSLAARTMLFSVTRGEGGANLIAPYFFDELGALRTLEHRKSAGYYGNELFYSHATDYGYSKTLDEARRQWQDGLPILGDLVEVIRREQPTIILSRFRGEARDGHGHHQMAGVASARAFELAADPTSFPEQIARGLLPFQPKKLYMNNVNPERRAEDRDAWTISLPTGSHDSLLGRSYAQVARFGLGFQRSQGISGHHGQAGPQPSYYRLVKSVDSAAVVQREEKLDQGLDVGIRGIADNAGLDTDHGFSQQLAELDRLARQALATFDFNKPVESVPILCEGLRQAEAIIDDIAELPVSAASRYSTELVLRRKIDEFKQAIILAMGISAEFWVEATHDQQFAVAGEPLSINVRIVNPSSIETRLERVELSTSPGWQAKSFEPTDQPLINNRVYQSTAKTEINHDAQPTRPYWRRDTIRQPFYEVAANSRQQPMPSRPVTGVIGLRIDETDLNIELPVEIRFDDPTLGNVRYPISLVPPISVRFPLSDGIVPAGENIFSTEVVLKSFSASRQEGKLLLKLPDGWQSNPARHDFAFQRANEERTFRFEIQPPLPIAPNEYPISAQAVVGTRIYSEGVKVISARDVGRLELYSPAKHRVRMVDVRLRGNPRVGYIAGSGDDVAAAIGMLGITPQLLSADDLAAGDLSRFNVILVGVRAYAVRADLRQFNARLLEYVYGGGNLIVQYQTPEFDNNFGPYPYTMGRFPEEVSEEDSQVTMLDPDHPVFNSPNKISSADFAGWFEQRGSKFLSSWDDRYVPLLECHDTGQDPQRGGLLVAKYGEGYYVYAAYAFYRQLPNGVPGAYRLFANLLSIPHLSLSRRE